MEHDADDWTRFARLLTGEATETEEVAHLQRLAADARYAASFEAARAAWSAASTVRSDWDVERMWKQFKGSTPPVTQQSRHPASPARRVQPNRRRHAPGVALISALLAAACVGMWTRGAWSGPALPFTSHAHGAEETGRRRPAPDAAPVAASETSASTRGEATPSPWLRAARAESRVIDLPDGTRVTLLPGSRLRLVTRADRAWGKQDRAVALDGEARFAVRRNPAVPFVVQAAHAEVRVLGTEFVLSTLAGRHGLRGEGVVAVAVSEGRVAVQHLGMRGPDGDSRVLRAGDAVAMTPTGALTAIRAADLLEAAEGRLVFDDATMGDVAREIARWYAVDVQFESADIERVRVSATFERGTVEAVLDHLAFVTGFRITHRGRRVRIEPGAL